MILLIESLDISQLAKDMVQRCNPFSAAEMRWKNSDAGMNVYTPSSCVQEGGNIMMCARVYFERPLNRTDICYR